MLPGATIEGIVRSGLTVRMGGPNEGERPPMCLLPRDPLAEQQRLSALAPRRHHDRLAHEGVQRVAL